MRRHLGSRPGALAALLITVALPGCDQAPEAPTPAATADLVTAVAPDAPPAVTPPRIPAPEPSVTPAPEPQAVDDDPPALSALRKDMPPDASDFIRRAVICNHWAGEEPYDEDRRAQIAAAVESLQCRELDADQASLRGRYADNPEVLRRLSQSRKTPL